MKFRRRVKTCIEGRVHVSRFSINEVKLYRHVVVFGNVSVLKNNALRQKLKELTIRLHIKEHCEPREIEVSVLLFALAGKFPFG